MFSEIVFQWFLADVFMISCQIFFLFLPSKFPQFFRILKIVSPGVLSAIFSGFLFFLHRHSTRKVINTKTLSGTSCRNHPGILPDFLQHIFSGIIHDFPFTVLHTFLQNAHTSYFPPELLKNIIIEFLAEILTKYFSCCFFT